MNEFVIKSINISKEKGTVKEPVKQCVVTRHGLSGDAHAGDWNRQVSLLGLESIERAEKQNNQVYKPGDFGENITTHGFDLNSCKILDKFVLGETVLELTQKGKKCHSGCQIMSISGNCIMPVEGIFCRVIHPGVLSAGVAIQYVPKVIKIVVITLSDRAYSGVYLDKSGPFASGILKDFFSGINRSTTVENVLLPDDEIMLTEAILLAVKNKADIIVTTGGTGIGSRDRTPDVVSRLVDTSIPGIMELIRVKFGLINPHALLSRSVAGVIKHTLIYTLPGSKSAVDEYLSEINKTLEHSIYMLNDIFAH